MYRGKRCFALLHRAYLEVMQIRSIPPIWIACLLLACGTHEAQPEQALIDPVDAEAVDTVPMIEGPTDDPPTGQVLKVPHRYLNEWERPSLDGWDPDLVALYSDSTGDVRERHADLDGDGAKDAAIFLRRPEMRSSEQRKDAYAVVVVFGAGGDTLLGTFSWAEAMGTIGAGLGLYLPHNLHHLGSEEEDIGSPVALEHSVLSLRYYEKSEVTWFWRDGRFHRVWTAD